MDIKNTLAGFGDEEAVPLALPGYDRPVAPDTVQRGQIAARVGRVFDLDETLVHQTRDELADGLQIDAGVVSQALQAGVNQSELVTLEVAGTPEKVIDTFFNQGEGILSAFDTADTSLFEERADLFRLPERPG